MKRKITIGLLFTLAMMTPGVAGAAIDPETKVALDTVWVLVAAFLVFWMNAGFALVESGPVRPRTPSTSSRRTSSSSRRHRWRSGRLASV